MAHDILKLLDQLEPDIRKAFLAAIDDVTSEAQMSVIIGALNKGDIESALHALHLKAEFFSLLDGALRDAYIQGGAAALAGLPVLPDPFPVGAWRRALMVEIHARKDG